jgi:hypothetical protein
MMKNDKHRRLRETDPDKDLPMKRFAQHIDKDAMSQFLENSGNERFDTLMLIMQDPAYAKMSFAWQCKKAGVTLHEMQLLYADGMRQLALLQMSNSLPSLMADVTEDAKTHMENCARCDGFGFVPYKDETRDCPTCKSTGTVRRVGDKQARDLVFESAKLIKQSGPLVAVTQNFGNTDQRMETILKKTREISLEPSRPNAVGSGHEDKV